MQQFQSPNYYGQQFMQPQYNPYLQRMENLQQFQQSIQQPMVPTSMSGANQFTPLGKIVESMDIVKVTDIPMDGNMYYFPKADGTEIYAKQFGIDGKARILTFKPFLDDEPNNSATNEERLKFDDFNNVLMGIQEDIRTLNEKIDKISKPTRVKKEVDNE